MFNKNILFALFLLTLVFAAISTVNAQDLNGTDEIMANDIDENIALEKNKLSQEDTDVIANDAKEVISIEESMLSSEDGLISQQNSDVLSAGTKSFSDLYKLINSNKCKHIYLKYDYKYNPKTDSKFKLGVPVSKAVTIHGNGHTLDGNHKARIFLVSNDDVVFRNINFINAKVNYYGESGDKYYTLKYENGGAILGYSTCINCKFINNYATNAGAMHNGTAIGCTFINNTASFWGGAMYYGSVYNCKFIGNRADYGGALWYCFACKNCYFKDNFASLTGGAVNTAPAINCKFINNYAMYGGALYEGSALDCVFKGNTADWGGAVYGAKVSSSKFTGNVADRYGGAIFKGAAIKCTFKNNKATKGGKNVYKTKTKLSTAISKKSKKVKRAKRVAIAILKDSAKGKVKNVKVFVKINGKTLKVKTNKKGEIKISTKKLSLKKYKVKIKFKGNKYYKKSAKTFAIKIK